MLKVIRAALVGGIALLLAGCVATPAKPPATPTPTPAIGIAAWGDSLTQSGLDANSWVAVLGRSLNVPFYNGGAWGQNADQTAARQGGEPALVTLSDNRIPTRGSAIVEALTVNVFTPGSLDHVYGTLAGEHGVLTNENGTVTFQRTLPGNSVTVPEESEFVPTDAETRRNWTQIIWVGRNGDNIDTVSAIAAMTAHAEGHVLILEVPEAEGWPSVHTTNHEIEDRWPDEFFPIAEALQSTNASEIAGIQFTPADHADIATGYIPRSFRDDAVHLNATGRAVVAELIRTELIERGWF